VSEGYEQGFKMLMWVLGAGVCGSAFV